MPAAMNKATLLAGAIKVLEKKYPPAEPAAPRPVLEELVYAVCREGVAPAVADAAFAKLKDAFFDWNEVRVSTVPEVAEVLAGLPDAGPRAQKIVEFLQELFEMTYAFNLDDLEKKGVKQAAKQLGRYQAASDFAVAWVTQRSLGGHAVPLDEPSLRVLRRLGIIDADADDMESIRGTVEHFVPKAKGMEFPDVFVQFAAAICLPGVPLCRECPLRHDCPTGQELLAKKADPKSKPKSR